mmetsp:Transcript_5189/g.9766  ORF Transcript_5189/g.9766 Transcript_5189/m.9766 type:complete len:316 (+) Transcript_5189:243-1190(+)
MSESSQGESVPDVIAVLARLGLNEMHSVVKDLEASADLLEQGKLSQSEYDALANEAFALVDNLRADVETLKPSNATTEQINQSPQNKHVEDDSVDSSKPLLSGFLHLRSRQRRVGTTWEKRFCLLYPQEIQIFREKHDPKPLQVLELTEEFFVSQAFGTPAGLSKFDNDEDSDNQSLRIFDMPEVRREFENAFVVSDLDVRYVFSASTENECIKWMQQIAAVIHTIMESARNPPHSSARRLNRGETSTKKEAPKRTSMMKQMLRKSLGRGMNLFQANHSHDARRGHPSKLIAERKELTQKLQREYSGYDEDLDDF